MQAAVAPRNGAFGGGLQQQLEQHHRSLLTGDGSNGNSLLDSMATPSSAFTARDVSSSSHNSNHDEEVKLNVENSNDVLHEDHGHNGKGMSEAQEAQFEADKRTIYK